MRAQHAAMQDRIGQRLSRAQGRSNLVKHRRADDAPALPDASELGEVDVPPLRVRRALDEGQALRVRAQLRRVERLLEVVDEARAGGDERPADQPSAERGRAWRPCARDREKAARDGEHRREDANRRARRAEGHASDRALPLRKQRREVARLKRGGHGRRRDALLGGLLHGPLARALGATAVLDHVDEIGAIRLRATACRRRRARRQPVCRERGVLCAQDGRRDLNEIAGERPLRPTVENGANLRVGQAAQRAHQVVRLADQLHVPVLDPVVYHLHVVASRAHPKVGDTRAVRRARGDRHVRRALPWAEQRDPGHRARAHLAVRRREGLRRARRLPGL
mmetsp:Transcript_11762/g.37281  ORF Transcript_11762/g.37281 Transcript_11762/m.37281 type:complete len:338 (+) Transcript_11762:848-1861(+)